MRNPHLQSPLGNEGGGSSYAPRNGRTALETALDLLRLGLWPVPLYRLGDVMPNGGASKGKEPIGNGWGLKRPTPASLTAIYQRHPGAGVGIRLGPEGGVIDLEIDGPGGEESLAKLFGGEVVDTLGWKSRRGWHRLFRYEPRLDAIGKVKLTHRDLPGLEIRAGVGGQAQSACPPSMGEDGQPRQWFGDTIQPLPEVALAYLERIAAKPEAATNGVGWEWTIPPAADPAAAWFRKALENEAGRVAMATEGARHDTLLRAARTLAGHVHHGYLTEAEIVLVLATAARRCGLDDAEIAETIRDGIHNGLANPLPWPEKLDRRVVFPPPGPPGSDGMPQPWPPLRLNQPPTPPPFPIDVFPTFLKDYALAVAGAVQTPIDLVGGAMLAVASAAIGQSVHLRLRRTWSEPPILFMLIVADPGKKKTPAIRVVGKPLAEIDHELRKQSRVERERWEASKKTKTRDGIDPPPGPEPPQRRAVVKDITRESLCVMLASNPRGLLCDPDEATAWVASMNQYKAKGSDRQFWLSLFSGVGVSVDRKGGGESLYAPFPFVTVIGGIPPEMLGNLHEDRGRDDGFFDRLLFVAPPPDAWPSNHWTEDELAESVEAEWTNTIHRLRDTKMAYDNNSDLERPFYVQFSPRGRAAWEEWYNRHGAELDDVDLPPHQAGAYSKLFTYGARLALVLSRLRGVCDPTTSPYTPGPVEACDVMGAARLVDYFKATAARVACQAAGGMLNRDAAVILAWIRRHRWEVFRTAELTAHRRRYREDPRALEAGLSALEAANAIRPIGGDATPRGRGRPALASYEVNPQAIPPSDNSVNSENRESSGHYSEFSEFTEGVEHEREVFDL